MSTDMLLSTARHISDRLGPLTTALDGIASRLAPQVAARACNEDPVIDNNAILCSSGCYDAPECGWFWGNKITYKFYCSDPYATLPGCCDVLVDCFSWCGC